MSFDHPKWGNLAALLRKRTFIPIYLFSGIFLFSLATFIWNKRLTANQQEREKHFIAIHFLAAEASRKGTDVPEDFDGLLSLYGGPTSFLARPFPDGLIYRRHGSSFTLEEPEVRRVSLLRSDRLVGSDQRWPRWERSGELAKKYPEQSVPPNDYQ